MKIKSSIFRLFASMMVISLITIVATQGAASARDNALTLGCRTVFKDNFHGATLKPGWVYVDPNDDVAYSLRDRRGYLRLSTDAPFGNDLYINSTNGARLLRELEATEFIIETSVDFVPSGDFQGGGLFVWQDASNFIRFERGLALGNSGIYFAANNNDNFSQFFLETSASIIQFKLVRTGSAFDGFIREPEGAWKRVGSFDLPFATSLQVGVDLVAEHGVPPTVIDYDYFVASTCNSAHPSSDD